MRDGAIVYDELDSGADLPEGWTDEQDGGTYRLRRARGPGPVRLRGRAAFLEAVPVAAARAVCGGREPTATASRSRTEPSAAPKDAYIGVRSCDLHAIALLDSALLDVPHPDPGYAARRENVFIVALNCWQAGGTCFCVSMETGPRATFGYDVALTEVVEDGASLLPGRAGSDAGAEVRRRAAVRDAARPKS